MKQIIKKVLSSVLVLVMVFALMPSTTLPVYGEVSISTALDLKTADYGGSSQGNPAVANAGSTVDGYYWNVTTGVLTLRNMTVEAAMPKYGAGISVPVGAEVRLYGDNYIRPDTTRECGDGLKWDSRKGTYSGRVDKLMGPGSLSITFGDTTTEENGGIGEF